MLTFDIDSCDHAMRQAASTAKVYAMEAAEFMEGNQAFKGWSPEAKATFMAGFMKAAALDYLGAANLSAGQHVARALSGCEDALNDSAEAQSNIAVHLKYLGNGDAATTMGAIENLAVLIKEGMDGIASAIRDAADND